MLSPITDRSWRLGPKETVKLGGVMFWRAILILRKSFETRRCRRSAVAKQPIFLAWIEVDDQKGRDRRASAGVLRDTAMPRSRRGRRRYSTLSERGELRVHGEPERLE